MGGLGTLCNKRGKDKIVVGWREYEDMPLKLKVFGVWCGKLVHCKLPAIFDGDLRETCKMM